MIDYAKQFQFSFTHCVSDHLLAMKCFIILMHSQVIKFGIFIFVLKIDFAFCKFLSQSLVKVSGESSEASYKC